MAKVFLGVGHGGSDPGAQGGGLDEADINLGIAVACQAELVRHGVQVRMSRTKDEDDPLTEEIQECNAYDPDLAVDIHTNAGGGTGFEAYHTLGGGKGKILAQNIEAEVKAIGQTSRGCKTRANSSGADYYGFIRQTKCPAVICECAFIDTAADRAKVDTADKQAVFGKAYARGILKTLGIKVQPEEPIASEDAETMIAASLIKERAGLEGQTIRYLLDYQYGEALVKKLADAIYCGNGADCVGTEWDIVQQAAGLEEQTMQYLKAYRYADALADKLVMSMMG
ncbi:N-acetylmuramoyl-L-alanine amidase [Butyricicoccus pullicaecorum]|uniref:N-acetylmuramoyl-L-alanine amidase n=1 Tax=Butyricicoccus pullicaecorum TaxID=501571 RepID=UPI00399094AF